MKEECKGTEEYMKKEKKRETDRETDDRKEGNITICPPPPFSLGGDSRCDV